jgi:hypothetical protein
MRYLLQRPLPDEILSSAFVRTCKRFDLQIKTLMKALDVNASAPSFFHMSNVGVYAQALQADPMELLQKATLFPSLVAFQSEERRRAFASSAISGQRSPNVGLSALQSATSFVPLRRLCSACVRSDKSRYGFAYWHVSHHLPGVSICARHGTRLRTTALTTSSASNRWSYALPDEVKSEIIGRQASRFDKELNRLAVATQAGEVWSALGPLPRQFYRNQLRRAGLLSECRDVCTSAAREWIAGHLKSLAGSSGLLQADPTLSWVDLILRERPGIPFPASKHLIVQAAIEITPPPTCPTLDHKSKGYQGKDTREIDLSAAMQLDARLEARLNTDERFTLRSELEALGLWHGFRHNRRKYPATASVLARHRPRLLRMKNRRSEG